MYKFKCVGRTNENGSLRFPVYWKFGNHKNYNVYRNEVLRDLNHLGESIQEWDVHCYTAPFWHRDVLNKSSLVGPFLLPCSPIGEGQKITLSGGFPCGSSTPLQAQITPVWCPGLVLHVDGQHSAEVGTDQVPHVCPRGPQTHFWDPTVVRVATLCATL